MKSNHVTLGAIKYFEYLSPAVCELYFLITINEINKLIKPVTFDWFKVILPLIKLILWGDMFPFCNVLPSHHLSAYFLFPLVFFCSPLLSFHLSLPPSLPPLHLFSCCPLLSYIPVMAISTQVIKLVVKLLNLFHMHLIFFAHCVVLCPLYS